MSKETDEANATTPPGEEGGTRDETRSLSVEIETVDLSRIDGILDELKDVLEGLDDADRW